MSAQTRSTNIAIFTRACWLAGYDLATVIRSCRKAGATKDEVRSAIDIYIANQNAVLLSKDVIRLRGEHLDRRAAS